MVEDVVVVVLGVNHNRDKHHYSLPYSAQSRTTWSKSRSGSLGTHKQMAVVTYIVLYPPLRGGSGGCACPCMTCVILLNGFVSATDGRRRTFFVSFFMSACVLLVWSSTNCISIFWSTFGTSLKTKVTASESECHPRRCCAACLYRHQTTPSACQTS